MTIRFIIGKEDRGINLMGRDVSLDSGLHRMGIVRLR